MKNFVQTNETMMQGHEEKIPENATEVKFVTPELAMPECEPLRAEIQIAANELRALKEVMWHTMGNISCDRSRILSL